MARNDLESAWKRSEPHERKIMYFLIAWSVQFFICIPFYLGEFQTSFIWSCTFLPLPILGALLWIRQKINSSKVKTKLPFILIPLLTGYVVLLSSPLVLIINANLSEPSEHVLSGPVRLKWTSSSAKHTVRGSNHIDFYSIELEREFSATMKNEKLHKKLKIGDQVETTYKKGGLGIYYQDDEHRGVVNLK